MNETGKTTAFVAGAVIAVAVGIWSHVGPADSDVTNELVVGKKLFDEFSPDAAKSLDIIDYDPDKLALKQFKVAQENGVWRIPSHDDYPADASQQLGEAAAELTSAEKVNLVSDDPTTHATYGVIDPDPKSLTAGTTGVGKRVTMEGAGGNKKLAQIIIGKAVKDKPDLHYVRYPGKDQVYVAKIKTDKFSTKFEDWIEKDLLKLNSFDIEKVSFNDYSLDISGARVALTPRAKIQVLYDSKDAKWKLEELEVFRGEEYVPEALAEEEELDSQKLNDLKNALDELKIVDVRRKPAGLAADLRAGDELAANKEAQASLVPHGFFVAENDSGEVGIYSNEGEIRCGTKDGVEYTLRFGGITAGGDDDESKNDEAAHEEGEGDAAKKGSGANRFIMVTAQFNEELLTKPELTPLPGETPAAQPETTGPETKEKAKEDAAKTSANDASLTDAAGLLAQADEETPKATDKAKPDSAKPDAAEKSAEKSGDKKEKEAATGSTKSDKDKSELVKPKTPEQLERERITKENEAKQKEYDDKVKKGKETAKELSSRFADWYYVVSDSTYQKIHLGRGEIVKKKTPPADTKADAHKHDDEKSDDVLSDDLKKLPN